MHNFYKTFIVFTLTVASIPAMAQEETSTPEPYPSFAGFVTNKFWDNWEISADFGTGFASFSSGNLGGYGDRFGLNGELSVTKWLHPVVGIRGQLMGGNYHTVHPTGGKTAWNFMFAHIDIVSNFSNWIGGYKEDRVYYAIPFAGMGLFASNRHTINYAFTAGLLSRFRVCPSVDINLEINSGEYVTILGPSGCGKTSLIKVISGIWTPTEGKVYFDGLDVTKVPMEDRDVGYVFQNIALFPHMTLKENVAYSPRVKDQGEEAMESLSTEYLQLVNMLVRAGMYPRELSGGEQQKVAIARALASGSKMLMLDEPLSALDARVRMELRYEIRRLVKKLGITVLHVTHDQEEAMSVSDRIVLMRYGSIAEAGSPLDIYRKPSSVFAANFIGETNLMECTVSDRSKSGKTKVKLRGGREIRASKTNFSVGDPVVISVRPEHVYPAIDGLEAEARALYPHRELNALQTVGYRELFDYFDGKIPYNEAVRLIKRNSRRYAKRQLTWFRRDPEIRWFAPDDDEAILAAIG